MVNSVWREARSVGRGSLIFLLTACCLLPTVLFAQDGGVPGALLNFGMTPRTIAMGRTFTGLADDQEALYYNPAGLVQLMSHNVKSSYLQLLGADAGYLGYAFPTKKYGSVGISIIYLGARNIDSFNQTGDPLGEFNFTQNCFLVSYAYQPLKPIGLGLNVKLLTSKIAQYGSLGMGGDVGVFLFPRGTVTFGIACQNLFGPTLTHETVKETVPLTVRAGGALKLYSGRVIIAVDVTKVIHDSTGVEPHLGVEFVPVKPILTLRGGLDRNYVSAGLGVRHDWSKFTLGFDYAIDFHYASSYLVEYQHRLGVFINFLGFRTWVDAQPKEFSPSPGRAENVAWLDVHFSTKRPIERWQLIIKNQYGEVVRTYSGWEEPPLRLSWDGLDDIGRVVADGRYFYEILLIDEHGETLEFRDFLTRVATLGPEGEIEFLPQE
jgi:hypothetical protein